MLTSHRKPSVHHEDDGKIDVEPKDSVSQVAESVNVTSSSTFIARQVKLSKKWAELEARHTFSKSEAEAKHTLEIAKAEAEAKQKHALEIAKAEEQLNLTAAKLDAKEWLIALSERGSSVPVSSKVGPISSSITLSGKHSNFREAFRADSKPHLRKMQLSNCAGEKSSSLLEGSVKKKYS